MTNQQLIESLRVVDEIVGDMCYRRGLRQEWEGIDVETQDEIRLVWAEIIHRNYDATPGGDKHETD